MSITILPVYERGLGTHLSPLAVDAKTTERVSLRYDPLSTPAYMVSKLSSFFFFYLCVFAVASGDVIGVQLHLARGSHWSFRIEDTVQPITNRFVGSCTTTCSAGGRRKGEVVEGRERKSNSNGSDEEI